MITPSWPESRHVRAEDTSPGRIKAMSGIHLLDRLIGSDYPRFTTAAEIRASEQTPYSERIAAQSTLEAIQRGATANPGAPAIQFLATADPSDPPLVIAYRDLIARTTQTTNKKQTHRNGPG